jgi:hypothetical protein
MNMTIELIGLLGLTNRFQVEFEARGAGPIELAMPSQPDDMGRLRSLWCPAYDRCLDAALLRKWRSWTCESCMLLPYARPFRSLQVAKVYAARRFDPQPDDGPRSLGP